MCDSASGKAICVELYDRQLGGSCRVDAECAVGLCNSKGPDAPFGGVCASSASGQCQCHVDADCGSAEFCLALVNSNDMACVARRPADKPCAAGNWCLSLSCDPETNLCE